MVSYYKDIKHSRNVKKVSCVAIETINLHGHNDLLPLVEVGSAIFQGLWFSNRIDVCIVHMGHCTVHVCRILQAQFVIMQDKYLWNIYS